MGCKNSTPKESTDPYPKQGAQTPAQGQPTGEQSDDAENSKQEDRSGYGSYGHYGQMYGGGRMPQPPPAVNPNQNLVQQNSGVMGNMGGAEGMLAGAAIGYVAAGGLGGYGPGYGMGGYGGYGGYGMGVPGLGGGMLGGQLFDPDVSVMGVDII